MNIQDEVIKIHANFGMSEKANYEIQLLCERYAKKYHEQQVKICLMADVVKAKRTCAKCGSSGLIMFTSDDDICTKCGHVQTGT